MAGQDEMRGMLPQEVCTWLWEEVASLLGGEFHDGQCQAPAAKAQRCAIYIRQFGANLFCWEVRTCCKNDYRNDPLLEQGHTLWERQGQVGRKDGSGLHTGEERGICFLWGYMAQLYSQVSDRLFDIYPKGESLHCARTARALRATFRLCSPRRAPKHTPWKRP